MSWEFPYYKIGQSIDWEQLCQSFDWLEAMKQVPQDPIWHAEGNVYIHTQMVVNALLNLPDYQALPKQEKHILFAAALLHDVEKRSTTITEILDGKERITAPKHALKGEYTSRAFLYKDYPTPFAMREQITQLVRWHGLPIWAIEKEYPRKAVIEVSLNVNTAHLAMLSKADAIGRICEDQDDLLYRIALFEELCKEHDCFGKPRSFKSDYGRYLFLNKPNTAPDYEPYDDLKMTVYVMCALPGTGKDTFIQNNFDLPVLSLDNIRRAHKIDPRDKKGNGQIIQLAKEQARVYLRAKTSFVYNATNITRDMRSRWISLFAEYGARVKIIYLEVPYSTLLKQNHNREHKVPENVLERMINRLEVPTFKEAHTVVYRC